MKKRFVLKCAALVSLSFLVAGNAHALSLTGDDWLGQDLITEDGDYLSGVFTNIDEFIIPENIVCCGINCCTSGCGFSVISYLLFLKKVYLLVQQK